MEGDSAQPTFAVQAEQCEAVESLQKGWALKGSKKAARFTADQRKNLEDKFRIGQETGHKADPEQVTREMWYARNERGERRFKVDEFLTAGQIQSFFSRTDFAMLSPQKTTTKKRMTTAERPKRKRLSQMRATPSWCNAHQCTP